MKRNGEKTFGQSFIRRHRENIENDRRRLTLQKQTPPKCRLNSE